MAAVIVPLVYPVVLFGGSGPPALELFFAVLGFHTAALVVGYLHGGRESGADAA